MTTEMLPTHNQARGFWGTVGSHADKSEAWAIAMTAIGKATGGVGGEVFHAALIRSPAGQRVGPGERLVGTHVPASSRFSGRLVRTT
jgi:hypothetical protein